MKKIISVILGIMLMLSMSVTSFAANLITEPVKATEDTVVKNVIVKTDFADAPFTDISTDTMILSAGKLTIKITNNLDTAISLSDFTIDVSAKCPKLDKDGKTIICDIPTVSIDGFSLDSDYVINKKSDKDNSDEATVICDLIINYPANKLNNSADEYMDTIFTVSINGIAKDTTLAHDSTREDKIPGGWLEWSFIPAPVVDTIPDTSNPAEDEDTSTEDTDTTPPADDKEDDITPPADEDVNTPDTDKGDEDVNVETPDVNDGKDESTDDPAPIDPEIPNTGATVPFAAIGTLVTSAITALVAKKKKEN
jgi:LPXTG-motif cell wall-anchored protein